MGSRGTPPPRTAIPILPCSSRRVGPIPLVLFTASSAPSSASLLGGGGGTKPCNLAALLAVGGVNRLRASREDLDQAFLRRGLPDGHGGPPKPLRWLAAPTHRTTHGNTFSAECRPSATAERPAALHERCCHVCSVCPGAIPPGSVPAGGGDSPCGGKYESTNSGATKSVPLLKK